MVNSELESLFTQPPHFESPNLAPLYLWSIVGMKSIDKKLWEGKVAQILQGEMEKFYKRYDYAKQDETWLKENLRKGPHSERTIAIAAQLSGIQKASAIPGKILILESTGAKFNSTLLASINQKNSRIDVLNQDYQTKLESLSDESLAAVIQYWTISRVVNPLEFIKSVTNKLKTGGIYVFIDRKPYETISESDYSEDGVARVVQIREIRNERFYVAKYYFKDLLAQLQNQGLQILFETRNDPKATYEIVVAIKSQNPASKISVEELIKTTNWREIENARTQIKKALKY